VPLEALIMTQVVLCQIDGLLPKETKILGFPHEKLKIQHLGKIILKMATM
jgi:hypothetical protein